MRTLGEAAVEIIAETGDFDDDLRRRLQQAVDESADEMREDLRRVSRQAEETGRSLRREIGEGAGSAARRVDQLEQVARRAEQAMQDMDPRQLRRVAEEADRARGQMQELIRQAHQGEGAFSRMNPEQIRRISEHAERAFRDMERLGNQTRRAADEVERFGNHEEIQRLAFELERSRRQAERLNQTRFRRLGGEARQAGRAVWQAFRGNSEQAERALRRIDNVQFRLLVRRSRDTADRVGRVFRRIGDGDRVGESMTRLLRAFTMLAGAAAAVGALGAALSGLVAVAGGVAAVVAPSFEIIAAAPAAVLMAAAAFATLKVALSGVGEAFSAALTGDAAEFEEALEGLAPSAAKVAREVRALKPRLDDLRTSVQGAFFDQLDGEITAVARNLLGPLKRGMTATAAEFGRLTRSVTTFGRSAEAADLVRDVFGALRGTLASVRSDTITNLLGSFSQFVRATLPGFDGLGGAIDGALGRLANFLGEAAAGGNALRWVREGTAAVRALGALLADLGRVVAGVFRAIQQASGGALGAFGRLADSMAAFVNSARGQEQLVAVFRGMNAIAAQTSPVLQALIGGLATLAPIIAGLAEQIGPTLTAAIQGLVPALEGVGRGLLPVVQGIRQAVEEVAASGALGQLGDALGEVLAAVAPLIPALSGALVSALRSLAVVAAALAPVLRVVASALAALLASPLGAALGPLIAQLILVRIATGAWGTALRSLLPVLKLAGKGAMSLGKSLVAAVARHPIGAVIVGIALALGFVLSRLEPVRAAFARLRDIVVDGFGRLQQFGASLLNTFRSEGPVAALRQLGSAIVSGLGTAVSAGLRLVPRLITGILSGIATAIAAVPGLLSQLGAAVQAGLQRAAVGIPAFARSLVAGLREAFGALREQAPQVAAALRTAVSGAAQALSAEGPRIASTLQAMLGSAFNALTSHGPQLAQQLMSVFEQVNSVLLRMAADGIRRAGDAVAQHLPGLATRLSDALTRMITRAGEVIPQVLGQLSQRISQGLGQAVGDAAGGAAAGGSGGGLQNSLISLILDVGLAVVEQIPKLTPVIVRAIAQISLAVAQATAQAAPGIIAAVGQLLLTVAQTLLTRLGEFLMSLPGRLLGWLAGLAPAMVNAGLQAMTGLLSGLVTGLGTVIGYVLSMPIRIAAGLAALGIYLFQRGSQAMGQLRSALASGGERAVAFVRGLPGRIAGALASLPGLLASRGSSSMSRLTSALSSGAGRAVGVVRGLPGRIVGALSGLAGQLAGVGRAAMSGFISGARSMAGQMVSAVVGPIRDAINQARSILKIGSPSKVFRDIGRFTAQGFVQGLTGEASKIQSTADKLVSLITKAFAGKRGKRTKTDDRLIALVRNTNTKLQALAKQRSTIAEQIKAANNKAAEVAQSVRQFASLTGAAGDLTADGPDTPVTSQGLADQLKDRLKLLQQFQRDLNDLARRGLSKDLVEQLIAAGPEQGAELARAIAAGSNSTIKELNDTQAAIAATSKSMGNQAADLLFDAGKRAGDGFLTGLRSQEKEITKLMTRLAEQVARTVKKTLKIKSPSRVMSGLGEDTLAGYLLGLEQMAPAIQAAMASAVRAPAAQRLAPVLAPAGRRVAPLEPARPAAGASGPGGGRWGDGWRTRPHVVRNTTVNAPVNLTIPTPDPEAAARAVSERIAARVTR